MQTRITALALAMGLAGQAQAIEFHGESIASPQLKRDTLGSLLPMAAAVSKCQSIDSVTMAIVVPPRNVKTNAEGVIVQGDDAVERWTTVGCGKTTRFKVVFSFDGLGGTYFNLSLE